MQHSDRNDDVSIVVEKYADMVRRICFLYLHNRADVEDVFQEVFLQYLLNADQFTDEQHQKAWLCRVTFNKCKNLCRSFWRKKVVSIEEMEIPYESSEQGEVIKEVLKLPSNYKEVIYLYYFEGWSVPEIAEMKGKNLNTIYSRLRYAKEHLKKKLEET